MIDCNECGKPVSTAAKACPACGHPMKVSGTVTTQATGKPYKFAELLGVILICCGVVSCVGNGGNTTALFFISGFVIYLAGRMGAWWQHG